MNCDQIVLVDCGSHPVTLVLIAPWNSLRAYDSLAGAIEEVNAVGVQTALVDEQIVLIGAKARYFHIA